MTTKAQITVAAKDEASGVLARIQREMAQVESVSLATSAALSGLTAGALGALSVGGLLAYAKAVTDGVDALNDLSDATGTSIENASALEDVARRAGHSFENVTKTLVKFNDVLNKATPGSEAERTLEALGLSVKELQALDPAEALRQTAVAFNGFGGEAEKARAAQTLFGRSIAEVAPFLKDLSEQTQLVGTVTTQAAQEADRFNKELARLQKDALDAARAITGPLVSGLNTLIATFKEGEKAGDGFFMTMLKQTELFRIFSGRDFVIESYESIRKQIELTDKALQSGNLTELQRQANLKRRAELQARLDANPLRGLDGVDTRAEDARLARQGKQTLQIKEAAKAKTEEKSAYEALNKTLAEQIAQQDQILLLGRELTAEEKLITKIRADAALSRVALTQKELAALDASLEKYRQQAEAIAQQARNEKVRSEAAAVYAKDYEDEQKAIADATQRRADADRRAEVDARKMLNAMEFENSLIGLSNADRELAIKLRELEALGIRKQSAEYEVLSKEIEKSLEVKRFAEAAKKEYEDVAAVALDLFKGNSDAAKRYVQQIIDEFYKLRVIEPILRDVFGITPSTGFDPFGVGSRKGSGFAGAFPGLTGPIFDNFDPFGLISFDGGGYTGKGARSGGMDGKGGFMAMLHPNEQVVDLTKGGGMGGMVFNNSIVVNGGGSDRAAIQRDVARAIEINNERLRRDLSAAKVI